MRLVRPVTTQLVAGTTIEQVRPPGAAAHDALLPPQVVGLDAARRLVFGGGLVALSGDALQQGIDFFLGEKVLAHLLLDDEGGE